MVLMLLEWVQSWFSSPSVELAFNVSERSPCVPSLLQIAHSACRLCFTQFLLMCFEQYLEVSQSGNTLFITVSRDLSSCSYNLLPSLAVIFHVILWGVMVCLCCVMFFVMVLRKLERPQPR